MDQVFCQSCAMPLSKPEDYGSNANGSRNEDYCKYCFEKGVFTFDGAMDAMIEICVPHMLAANAGMTEDQAREMMRRFFPQLKRWKAD